MNATNRVATRNAVLASLEAGATRSAAAAAARVHRTTVWRWCQEDAEFAERVELAELAAVAHVEGALFRAATGERPSVTACLAFLYSRHPSEWQDRRRPQLTESVTADQVRRIERLAASLGALEEVKRILAVPPSPEQVQLEQDYLDQRITELIGAQSAASNDVG